MPKLNLIFGAGGIGQGSISHTWTTPSETNELLITLQSLNLLQLDSATGSPPGAPWETEKLLGQSHAAEKGFLIDTKILMSPLDPEEKEEMKGKGMGAGGLSEKNIEASLGRNRKLLELGRGEKVNVLYAHLPDPVTPIEESVRAFDSHFRRGDCKELGISNFRVENVKEWMKVCEEGGYIKPTVYQGHYNALCRQGEEKLFPLLREHGVKFYAFGPLAGGFLTDKASLKTPETDLSGTRWVRGGHSFYPATFDHPAVHEAVKKFRAVCEENGISSTEASFRWLVHHSALRDGEPRVLWEGAFG